MKNLFHNITGWLKNNIDAYIDLKYLITKIAILVFSGLISIAPIFFVGLEKVFGNSEAQKSVENLYVFIKSNTDVVYALVGLSTIVLADVLGSNKENGVLKYVCGLFHILAVLFGSLIYAYYKTHNVDVDVIVSLNVICVRVVAILSVLSYINLAIVSKSKEEEKDEH